ncbi:hypothetical protein BDA96_07G116800 [Sorghum bicolor]|uniref:Uncharacterized protein n=2 Tax=Sorghum bicolor TaxID=4558 RepID=A0A921UA94_SORBI|nr:hypothetical protein BDA96_07G116800 [Sorghum bicolor]KXG25017.1 hypothetical protein SORBI_3007G110400 [Sorghum bicolor]
MNIRGPKLMNNRLLLEVMVCQALRPRQGHGTSRTNRSRITNLLVKLQDKRGAQKPQVFRTPITDVESTEAIFIQWQKNIMATRLCRVSTKYTSYMSNCIFIHCTMCTMYCTNIGVYDMHGRKKMLLHLFMILVC